MRISTGVLVCFLFPIRASQSLRRKIMDATSNPASIDTRTSKHYGPDDIVWSEPKTQRNIALFIASNHSEINHVF